MTARPTNLDPYWMPFTANRAFKQAPRMFVAAKDMHYVTDDGRQVLDGTAGLWCVNAGHCRPRIVEAVQKQVAAMDYSPAFQMGHPDAFRVAERIAALTPGDLDRVFYCNSGSEGVDTALKIALAYHRARGEGQRNVLIGRERGYHGAGFGGISVGGIPANRKAFGNMLFRVDHLAHTHNLAENAFSRGQPAWGAHLADELENRIIPLHDAGNIAAVIVEPLAGSTGVLVPPKGYLERLRQICDKHGLLLIFDEVITGFGRTGPCFAADAVGVVPDMMIIAKGLTNGTVPMGAVVVREDIYDAVINSAPPGMVELFHGYTYSGHPLATAAALASLDTFEEEGLFQRAQELAPYFEQAVQSLRELPHVIDVRNMGMVAGIELEPRHGEPTARAFEAFLKCYEDGALIRTTGDIIALSPPLIISKSQIDELIGIIAQALRAGGRR
ncbi:MAG: aspartate aminotransferase family protein [Betaproteobacteria bacterium]|nr:aspartate aminotransferase family protein [Betaproteobacteria bacterium]MDH5342989.1 aspartate aminotransferase family protein [Betaproteobacteria bacterium]